MNEREVAELRRRFRQDRSGISHVRGCYVNENREIVSQFDQSLGVLTQEENEKLLTLLRRTLTGTLGKKLLDITFATQQVVHGAEHKRLMDLRASELKDEEAVGALFQAVIQSVNLEGNYMILLAHDAYDVPYRAKDGELQEDASSEVYSYILCCVCPIKPTKPALSYYVTQNEFHNRREDWLVGAPELGFLFPAFDDRCANLYGSLYYTRSAGEIHEEFIRAVFQLDPPMPAEEQKEAFQEVLAESLAEECSYEVMQTVHEKLCGLIEDHKANKEEEPLAISRETVRQVLSSCGVEEGHVAAFEEKYDEAFGEGTEISPQNLVNVRQFELRTPDVVIKVNPERRDLVETRVINGAKYILIRADEGVEVNGVSIHIEE